ncbi:uncharacterized protein LOC117460705 [Scomber scombrus]|uniref:Uncharacterized protein LOC117460705 n=1 Tax=Scomber scombrus TaxID=13677 RepID=A0AAV1PRD2_SCOSC
MESCSTFVDEKKTEEHVFKVISQCPECQARRVSLKEKSRYNPIEITDEKVEKLVVTEVVCDVIQQLPRVYKEVQGNVIRSQKRVRERKEDRGQDDNFKPGDHVLMKNIWEQQRKGGKLEKDMLGPYEIMNITNKTTQLRLLTGTGKIMANIDHLVHYIEPEERVPVKLRREASPSPLASDSSPSVTGTPSVSSISCTSSPTHTPHSPAATTAVCQSKQTAQ